jgi:Pyridoxamine 5'-phosphate oxidase
MATSRKGAKSANGTKKKTVKRAAPPAARVEAASAPESPRAGRPNIPGYGIVGEQEGGGLLAWSWAEQRLTRGWNYWLVTARPDGRPHLMPVWGLWWEGAFWFSTGEKTVKARNLAANPNCVVAPDRGDEAVIVEGRAEWVAASDSLEPLWAAYKMKYKWNVKGMGFFVVRPQTAFGFIEKGEQFTQTATRWSF